MTILDHDEGAAAVAGPASTIGETDAVEPDAGAEAAAGGLAVTPSGARTAPPRWRRRLVRAVAALALVGLAVTAVSLRAERDARRADAARAEAAAVRTAAARGDARLLAEAIAAELGLATLDGAAASDARAAQQDRLAALGLSEETMRRALDEARLATAGAEADRNDLLAVVERQAGEVPQLKECLAEVRRAVDAAFHASNRPDLAVPAPSEICRALGATPG